MDIRSLVAYLISRLTDIEASFGKTKLVKLLYLIDVEFYKLRSRKLTSFDWIFYHYGPYAPAIDDVLTQLELDIPQEDIRTTAGYRAKIFKAPKEDLDTEFEEKASSLEKSVVERVLREWGLEELNPLLSYVYFHTEPMKDAHRGEVLDFSKITHPSVDIKATKVPTVSHKELRDSFLQIKGKRSLLNYESLNPKPRIDEVFASSLANLEAEEHQLAPKGEVGIQEDSKGRFREQV
jgi:hypothetical protein